MKTVLKSWFALLGVCMLSGMGLGQVTPVFTYKGFNNLDAFTEKNNGYTVNLNGNTVDSQTGTVTIGEKTLCISNTTGWSGGTSTYASDTGIVVILEYAGVTPNETVGTLFGYTIEYVKNDTNNTEVMALGLNDSHKFQGVRKGDWEANTESSAGYEAQSGYLVLKYIYAAPESGGESGTQAFYWDGTTGDPVEIFKKNGWRYDNGTVGKFFTFGGRGDSADDAWSVINGLQIKGVRVCKGTLADAAAVKAAIQAFQGVSVAGTTSGSAINEQLAALPTSEDVTVSAGATVTMDADLAVTRLSCAAGEGTEGTTTFAAPETGTAGTLTAIETTINATTDLSAISANLGTVTVAKGATLTIDSTKTTWTKIIGDGTVLDKADPTGNLPLVALNFANRDNLFKDTGALAITPTVPNTHSFVSSVVDVGQDGIRVGASKSLDNNFVTIPLTDIKLQNSTLSFWATRPGLSSNSSSQYWQDCLAISYKLDAASTALKVQVLERTNNADHSAAIYSTDNPASMPVWEGNSGITDDKLHHWVIVTDTASMTLYVDGEKIGDSQEVSSLGEGSTYSSLELGGHASRNRGAAASFADVRVYNVALGEKEITALYNAKVTTVKSGETQIVKAGDEAGVTVQEGGTLIVEDALTFSNTKYIQTNTSTALEYWGDYDYITFNLNDLQFSSGAGLPASISVKTLMLVAHATNGSSLPAAIKIMDATGESELGTSASYTSENLATNLGNDTYTRPHLTYTFATPVTLAPNTEYRIVSSTGTKLGVLMSQGADADSSIRCGDTANTTVLEISAMVRSQYYGYTASAEGATWNPPEMAWAVVSVAEGEQTLNLNADCDLYALKVLGNGNLAVTGATLTATETVIETSTDLSAITANLGALTVAKGATLTIDSRKTTWISFSGEGSVYDIADPFGRLPLVKMSFDNPENAFENTGLLRHQVTPTMPSTFTATTGTDVEGYTRDVVSPTGSHYSEVDLSAAQVKMQNSTIAFWGRINADLEWGDIFGIEYRLSASSSQNEWQDFQQNNLDQIAVYTNNVQEFGAQKASNDALSHWVLVTTATEQKLYLNGVLNEGYTKAFSETVAVSADSLIESIGLGGISENSGHAKGGISLADVRVYNAVLSEDEIEDLAKSSRTIAAGETVYLHPAIQGAVNVAEGGTLIVDATTSQTLKTLTGAGTVIKKGAETLTLKDATAFTGTIQVKTGILKIEVTSAQLAAGTELLPKATFEVAGGAYIVLGGDGEGQPWQVEVGVDGKLTIQPLGDDAIASVPVLRISEIMPKGSEKNLDPNGLESGWVELYNPTDKWVDLADYRFIRINRSKQVKDAGYGNFPSVRIPPGGKFVFYTSECYPNGAAFVEDGEKVGLFGTPDPEGAVPKFYTYNDEEMLVWPDKVNPKKFPFVRLYYAPAGGSKTIVDTVVVPSDLPENASIIVGDASETESTLRWIDPNPTKGTANPTDKSGLTRLGPNVGPLYEFDYDKTQKDNYRADEFGATEPATPGTAYPVTLPINPVMAPTGETANAKDAITSVKLIYRKGFGTGDIESEKVSMTMSETPGTYNEGNLWTAEIPAGFITDADKGHLIQWKVEITDASGETWTSPSFNNKEDGYEWYGTIVADDTLESEKLPTWHMFADAVNVEQMDLDADFDSKNGQDPTKVPYNARVAIYDSSTKTYYDYVRIDLRGQTSATFAKKSHGLRFAKVHPVVMKDPLRLNAKGKPMKIEARKSSLISEFADPTWMRQMISLWLLNEMGSKTPFDFPVRCNLNGAFYQLAFHSERFTDELLEDFYGLDKYGYGFKNAASLENPQNGTMEKKLPDDGDEKSPAALKELWDFCNALQTAGGKTANATEVAALSKMVVEKFDLPAWLNYMAATRITHEADDTAANLGLYYDNPKMMDGTTRGTGTWTPYAYDMNLSFGQWYCNTVENATGLTATNDDYKSHPFYGGTMTVGAEGNRMYEAIFQSPKYRRLYLRRLRTLMDAHLGAPDVTEVSTAEEIAAAQAKVPFFAKMQELAADLKADSELDYNKWRVNGDGTMNTSDAKINVWGASRPTTIEAGLEDLWTNYVLPRRTHLYVTHSVNSANYTDDGTYGKGKVAGIPNAQSAIATLQAKLSARYDATLGAVIIRNMNDETIDLSGWTLTGPVEMTLPPGTVIDQVNGTTPGEVYVTANRRATIAVFGEAIHDQVVIGNGTATETTTITLTATDEAKTTITSTSNTAFGETFDYVFNGLTDANYTTVANWDVYGAALSNSAPGLNSSNIWGPILLDGNQMPSIPLTGDYKKVTHSGTAVEGWTLRLGLTNHVHLTVASLNKLQSNGWIRVDETSKLTVTAFGSGNWSDKGCNFYISAPSGLVFSADLSDKAEDRTFSYYLDKEGSVQYAAMSNTRTHEIKSLVLDVGTADGKKPVLRERQLIGFTSQSGQTFRPVQSGLDITTTLDGTTAVAYAGDGELTAANCQEVGTYQFEAEPRTNGYYVRYIGYGDFETVADGVTRQVEAGKELNMAVAAGGTLQIVLTADQLAAGYTPAPGLEVAAGGKVVYGTMVGETFTPAPGSVDATNAYHPPVYDPLVHLAFASAEDKFANTGRDTSITVTVADGAENNFTWSERTGENPYPPTMVTMAASDGTSKQTIPVAGKISVLNSTLSLWTTRPLAESNNWQDSFGVQYSVTGRANSNMVFERDGSGNTAIYWLDGGTGATNSDQALVLTTPDDNLHHIVIVAEAEGQTVYLDGVKQNATPIPLFDQTAGIEANDTYTNICLGGLPERAHTGATASFADVRMYDTALTAEQVAALYNDKPIYHACLAGETAFDNITWENGATDPDADDAVTLTATDDATLTFATLINPVASMELKAAGNTSKTVTLAGGAITLDTLYVGENITLAFAEGTTLTVENLFVGENRTFMGNAPAEKLTVTGKVTLQEGVTENDVIPVTWGMGGDAEVVVIDLSGIARSSKDSNPEDEVPPEVTVETNDSGALEIHYPTTLTGRGAWYEFHFNDNLTNTGNTSATVGAMTATGVTPSYADSDVLNLSTTSTAWIPKNQISYPADADWAATFYAKMPTEEGAVLIGFGGNRETTKGAIALARGRTLTEMLLVHVAPSTQNTPFTVLARMTVPNATTAYHLYTFVVRRGKAETTEDDTVEIYLDETPWLIYRGAVAVDNGIQVGSILDGFVADYVGNTERFTYNQVTLKEATDGAIDMLRIYNCELSESEVSRTVAEGYDYVSTGAVYERTVSTDELTEDTEHTANWVASWTTKAEDKTKPSEGALVTLTANTMDAVIAMNQTYTVAGENAVTSQTLEALTLTGSNAITLNAPTTVPDGEALMHLTVTGVTTIETDAQVEVRELTLEGPVNITEGKTLTLVLTDEVLNKWGNEAFLLGANVKKNLTGNLIGKGNITIQVVDEKWAEGDNYEATTGAGTYTKSGWELKILKNEETNSWTAELVRLPWEAMIDATGEVTWSPSVPDGWANGYAFLENGPVIITANNTEPKTLNFNGPVPRMTVKGSGTVTLAPPTQEMIEAYNPVYQTLTLGALELQDTATVILESSVTFANHATLAVPQGATLTATSDQLPASVTTSGGLFNLTVPTGSTFAYTETYMNSAITVETGATLTASAGIHNTVALTLKGGATLAILKPDYVKADITVEAGETPAKIYGAQGGNGFLINNESSIVLNGDLELANGALNANNCGNKYTIECVISGTGKLIVNDVNNPEIDDNNSSSIQLTGANTFKGGLVIGPGVVLAAKPTSVGAGDITLDATATLKMLDNNATTTTVAQRVLTLAKGVTVSGAGTIDGAVTFADGAILDATGGAPTITGGITPATAGNKMTITGVTLASGDEVKVLTVGSGVTTLDATNFSAKGLLGTVKSTGTDGTAIPPELWLSNPITVTKPAEVTDNTVDYQAPVHMALAAAAADAVNKVNEDNPDASVTLNQVTISTVQITTGSATTTVSDGAAVQTVNALLDLFENVDVAVEVNATSPETSIATISYDFGIEHLTIRERSDGLYVVLAAKVLNSDGTADFAADTKIEVTCAKDEGGTEAVDISNAVQEVAAEELGETPSTGKKWLAVPFSFLNELGTFHFKVRATK